MTSHGDSKRNSISTCYLCSMETAREILDYAHFGVAIRELGQTIVNDEYRPDLVLCIARGGLIVGGALGYAIGVKNTFTMSVEFYVGVNERLPMPVVLPPVPNRVDLAGAKVLIADDVADTDATLELVQNFCLGHVAEVRSAVLYSKPQTIIKPNYSWKETDKWIDFPWSSQPPFEYKTSRI